MYKNGLRRTNVMDGKGSKSKPTNNLDHQRANQTKAPIRPQRSRSFEQPRRPAPPKEPIFSDDLAGSDSLVEWVCNGTDVDMGKSSKVLGLDKYAAVLNRWYYDAKKDNALQHKKPAM